MQSRQNVTLLHKLLTCLYGLSQTRANATARESLTLLRLSKFLCLAPFSLKPSTRGGAQFEPASEKCGQDADLSPSWSQVELRCPALLTCNLGEGANSKLKQMHLASRSLSSICWQGFGSLSDVHIACPSLTSVCSGVDHSSRIHQTVSNIAAAWCTYF